MGLEFTRGNSQRCPPFLVGGLMIMCLFLLCSWWSLSSQNFELLRQNDNLAEQLRINGEELRKCKECQSKVAELEVQIRQIRDSDQELQQSCQKEKHMCQTEMESLKQLGESKEKNLETLRANKKALEKDLEEEKQNVDDLKKELEKSKQKLNDLEKRLLEGNEKKNIELGKKITSGKLNNSYSIDINLPIAKMMQKNIDKKDTVENDLKFGQNEAPVGARPDSPYQGTLHDENTGGEIKNDDPDVEAADPREEVMSDHGNNGNNGDAK